MMNAMLSRVRDKVSGGTTLSSGTCWVKHMIGPSAHSNESSNTDNEPETAIWPKNILIVNILWTNCRHFGYKSSWIRFVMALTVTFLDNKVLGKKY